MVSVCVICIFPLIMCFFQESFSCLRKQKPTLGIVIISIPLFTFFSPRRVTGWCLMDRFARALEVLLDSGVKTLTCCGISHVLDVDKRYSLPTSLSPLFFHSCVFHY